VWLSQDYHAKHMVAQYDFILPTYFRSNKTEVEAGNDETNLSELSRDAWYTVHYKVTTQHHNNCYNKH